MAIKANYSISSHANGGNGFDWTVIVRGETQFFFVIGDGNGTGGSTHVQNIGSGLSSCISSTSPSSTPIPMLSGSGDGNGNGNGSGDRSRNRAWSL